MHKPVYKKLILLTLLLATVLFGAFSLVLNKPSAVQAAAGVNEQVNYQGRLLTATGAVVPDGTYNMEFKIIQDGDGCNPTSGTPPCGGTVEWTETRTSGNKVTVKNGYFSVYLGSVTPFSGSVDWNQDTLWLSVNIGGTGSPSWDGEMEPFNRLSATPYALNSKSLGGLVASNFVQLAQGSQTDATTLSSIYINKTGASGNILELEKNGTDVFLLNNTGAVTFQNTVDSTTGFQVLDADGGTPVFNVDTTNERVGIGDATPDYTLDVGGTLGVDGVITAGSSNTVLTLASGMIDADAITLVSAVDGRTGTSSASGLAAYSDGLSLLQGCSNGQSLAWVESTDTWDCTTVAGTGANTALSNLASVAINTALLPGADNTIDLGGSSFSFRTAYIDTSVLTPLVDTSGALSLGTGSSTSTALGKTGTTLTINPTAWTATPTISGLITATSGVTANGTLTANAGVVIGDASGDTVTVNSGAWTFANDTTVALSGGVNGINFDSDTLSIDATNNRVGIGTAAPANSLTVNGTADIQGHAAVGAGSTVNGGLPLIDSLFGVTSHNTILSAYETSTTTGSSSVGYDGLLINNILNPSGTANYGQANGMSGFLSVASGNAQDISTMGGFNGFNGGIVHGGTGTISGAATGVNGAVANLGGGIIDAATGVSAVILQSSGTINTAKGVNIATPLSFGGTITNSYGLYVNDHSGVGVTDSYNIYSAGASSENYLEGALTVAGSVLLTNTSSTPLTITSSLGGIEIQGITENGFNFYTEGSQFYRIDSNNDTPEEYYWLNGANGTIAVLDENGNIDYEGTITAGSSNTVLTLSTGMIDGDALTLVAAADGGTGTSSGSGLVIRSDGVGLLQGCSDGQVLAWVESTDTWDCATVSGGSGANTALSNLASVAINTSLLPASDDAIDLGDNTHRWRDLFLGPATLHIGTSTSDEYALTYDTTNNTLEVQAKVDSTEGFQILDTDGGTPIFNVDTVNERVGIGLADPATTLMIQQQSNGANIDMLRLRNSGTGDGTAVTIDFQLGGSLFAKIKNEYVSGSYLHLMSTGSTPHLTIGPGGNVGIGDASPLSNLSVAGTSTASPSSTNAIFKVAGSATNALIMGTLTGSPFATYIQSGGSGVYPLSLNPNGGKVGIGTTAPGQDLNLVTATAWGGIKIQGGTASSGIGMQFQNNNGYDWEFNVGGSTHSTIANKFSIYDADVGADRLVIDTNGNVGIGDTSPDFKLELEGTSSVTDRKIGINNIQVVYLPDQGGSAFSGSIFFGSGGTALSHSSGEDGYRNTGVGIQALNSVTTGQDNTATGFAALFNNNTGDFNTATGAYAMADNTTGFYNTATGFSALLRNTSGESNTALGFYAMEDNKTGNYNTATGRAALIDNTTGSSNNAYGYQALFSSGQTVTAGSFVVGVAYTIQSAGNTDFTLIGAANSNVGTVFTATGVGSGTGTASSNTNNNNAFGRQTLYDIISGSNNTAIGHDTGRGIITGSNNTIIGSNVSGLSSGLSNNIIIADGSGNQRLNVDSSGNVGIGTTTPAEKLEVNGNILIGGQTDSASTGDSTYSLINSAAGTFVSSTDINNDKITSMVVYEGKLFAAVGETDAAAVYRWDGGTTWVRVTSTTLGRAISGDATNIDGFVMTVFDGKLFIGSQTGGTTGAVYYSTTADTASAGDNFTLLNATRGTFSAASAAGVQDMTVYNGNLIIGTQKTDLAEVVRYEGGTTFTRINPAVGKAAAETTAVKDSFNLTTCNNVLFWGGTSGLGTTGTTAIVGAYQGSSTTTIATNSTTTGTFGADTLYEDIDSLTCWNGSLYVSVSKAAGNAAAIYYYKVGGTPVSNVPTNYVRINTAVGKMLSADSAVIDKFTLRSYRGRLYAGSQTATGDGVGALFEYSGIPKDDFTLMTTGARGTFGSQTTIDSVNAIQEFNGTLYIGTDDSTNNVGSVYTWSKTASNSYALRFESGNNNYGALTFVGDVQSADNNGHHGSFLFNSSVQLSSAAFDYAEDYPTLDSTLEAGEPVSVDPRHPEHVKRAVKGEQVLGVVSKNPGFRLSSNAQPESGAEWVPIALVGRVPVKVTTHGGSDPISSGDSLALSPTPGILEKANPNSGAVVGVALDNYTGDVVGTVSLFVSPQVQANPVTLTTNQTDAGLDYAGKHIAVQAEVDAAEVFSAKDKDGNQTITFDADGNATFAGTITADKIIANKIEGLEILTNKISRLESQVAGDTNEGGDGEVTAPVAAPPVELGNATIESATITLDMNVSGMLFANGGLKVDGPSEFMGDAIFNSLVSFIGPSEFIGDANFAGRATFNSDSGGFAVIQTGKQEVKIVFDRPYAEIPVVSLTNKNGQFVDYAYKDLTKDGFTIILKDPATSDVEMSWTALSVKQAKVTVSP